MKSAFTLKLSNFLDPVLFKNFIENSNFQMIKMFEQIQFEQISFQFLTMQKLRIVSNFSMNFNVKG